MLIPTGQFRPEKPFNKEKLMKSEFSELSFAFAYMADLTKKISGNLTMAPSFPNTVTEGKKGYGYDVKLVASGIPVFIQFKLANCMKNKNAAEFGSGKFIQDKPAKPVYRFYLMALGKSRQTSLMLKLEKKHDCVFYVAPAFHKVSELNSYFLSSSVVARSRAFRPSAIKKMPDKLEHFVSYRLTGPTYRFSNKPELIGEGTESLISALESADSYEVDASVVLESLFSILSERGGPTKITLDALRKSEEHPAIIAQYLARTFFGCELTFFRKNRKKSLR
jgi:hypothetical protein